MSARTTNFKMTEAGEALALFLRSHRVLFDEIDGELRDQIGLSFALWEVLVVLGQAPTNRLRMVEVTKKMCVSKSNVTQLIDKLEHAGLVTRESSPADRRLTYAALTKQGADAARRGGKIFNTAAKEHFAQYMTAEETARIVSGLRKVVGAHEPESLEASATA